MALIKCPECGKDISDKVKTCPHCGYPLIEEDIQKVEVVKNKSPEKKAKRKKIIITIIILLLIAGIGGGVYYKIYSTRKAEEQAKLEDEYYSNYVLQYYSLLSYASKCEEITGTVYDVWYKSIYEDNADDFNTNIACLYSGDEYKTNRKFDDGYDLLNRFGLTYVDIRIFRDNVSSVGDVEDTLRNQVVKELKNPPGKYKEIYDELITLYDIYQGLSAQALNPSGNISDFSSDVSNKKSTFLTQYKKIDVLLSDFDIKE